jgi:anti-anti-sigma factor
MTAPSPLAATSTGREEVAPGGSLRRLEHHLDVRAEHRGTTLVLVLEGRLDWNTAPLLRSAVEADPSWHALVVDIEALDTLDASGTGAILLAVLTSRDRGAPMAIAAFEPAVLGVLLTAGIGLVVPITATATDALRLVEGEPQVAGACGTTSSRARC